MSVINKVHDQHCSFRAYVEHQKKAKFPNQHWDYSGPYHGYDGFAIFARDMDLALNSPTWGLISAPWNKTAKKAKTKASV